MKKYILFLLFSLLSLWACQDVLFEEEPANDPIGNFESLWNTFNERYAVFAQRSVDWQSLYEQYRPQVNANTTDDQLFEIITAMLSHLDDGHVSLMAKGEPFWSGSLEFRERAKDKLFDLGLIQDNYVNGNLRNINNQYFYGAINEDIGYLFINFLSGEKPTFIDDFIAEMQNKKGLIIDLRHNGGGDFTNAEVIASRFADQRTLAFSGQAKNGPGPEDYGETTDYFIEAVGPAQFIQPIVVLTDDYTISAGENLVLYLRVLPNTTIIGENTSGAMGERIEKELPNGWIYSITGQIIRAADGISYEGPGVPPDIYAQNSFAELDKGMDRVLEMAIESIND